ncbi:phosphatase PAP2 family protein [Streptomyces sp. NPDC058385]|uniref:phosphatase PAP2 family protein n=1 Tax=Streptomyces sp. NPDC058385 TaxID=3346473 RepID=UPI0036561751
MQRPRPLEAGRFTACHGPSFPPRHVTTAFVAAALITQAGPAAGLIGGSLALSRVKLRAHWPTDVRGGLLFGYAWLDTARCLEQALARPR